MPPSPAAPDQEFVKPHGTPRVCYVTDRKALSAADPGAGVRESIAAAIQAGADWVQIREKDLPARELLALARAAVAMAGIGPRADAARVMVNDRLDVALAAGAAGVHLGRESLALGDVVRWCRGGNAPAQFLAGVSCHNLEQARQAERAGASYIFFGPIFDTPSKREFGRPQGIPTLAEVCRAIRLPVIAIGGVNEENAGACLRAGAAGVAAIRLFQESRDTGALGQTLARLHGAG
jgi:thiamine-phosphate pyrophosphorylase